MNQIYKKRFLTLFCLLGLQIICFAQHKSILLLDIISNEPIEFAYVFSESFNTVSDSSGMVLLPLKNQSEDFYISHINYRKETINYKNIGFADTIFLNPVSFDLDEITVVSTKQKTDVYKLINEILKKYHKSSNGESLHFTYLLKTIRNRKIVEQVNTNITVNYRVGSKCSFPNKWLNFGNFDFSENAPFINLDLEQLIFRLHPFHSTEEFNLLTSHKISKRNHTVRFLACDSCGVNQVKLIVESESQSCILTIDIVDYKMINAIYKINNRANLSFHRIADDSRYSFKELILRYEFNDDGFPLVIDGDVYLTFLGNSVNTKFIFYRTEIHHRGHSFLVLGKPNFQNIYEQMILQPSIGFIPTDTSSFLVDTALLARFDEEFRKGFIEANITGKKLIYLNQPIDSLPIRVHFVNEDFYIDKFGKYIEYQSDLKIYQSFNIHNNGISDTLLSIFPVIDLSNSRIFSKTTDPYYNQWALMLISYLYEASRQSLVQELNSKKKYNLDSLVRTTQDDFNKNRIQYNELLDRFLLNNNHLLTMVKLNHVIDSIIGYNVFDHVISKNYNCRECKETLIREISKTGYRLKRNDENKYRQDAYVCFLTGLTGMKHLLNEAVQEGSYDKRVVGGYYSVTAELHIQLNNKTDACECLNKFKSLWIEGFNLSSKKEFYYNNCVE